LKAAPNTGSSGGAFRFHVTTSERRAPLNPAVRCRKPGIDINTNLRRGEQAVRRILVVFTLVVSMSLIGSAQNTSKKAGGQKKQSTASAQDKSKLAQRAAKPDWAVSLEAFLRDLDNWQGPKPGATVRMLNDGQVVSDKWGIMRKYRVQAVTWEATVKGLTRGKLLLSEDGGASKEMDKIDAKFPENEFAVMVHVYADPKAMAQWRDVPGDARVAITARVAGVGFMNNPLGDKLIHVVTLRDAVPTKILQDAELVIDTRKKQPNEKIPQKLEVGAEKKQSNLEESLSSGKMITTESGLKYIDVVEGTGPSPQKGQTIVMHYTGTLEDGKKFDSTEDRDRPFEIRIGMGQLLKGLDEGMMTMKVGGKRRLIIPANLGYGAKGAGGGTIPPNATLIFEVELLEVK